MSDLRVPIEATESLRPTVIADNDPSSGVTPLSSVALASASDP
jgi:hypothetical protein